MKILLIILMVVTLPIAGFCLTERLFREEMTAKQTPQADCDWWKSMPDYGKPAACLDKPLEKF